MSRPGIDIDTAKLREVIRKAGTMAHVARKAGTHRATLWNIAHGIKRPGPLLLNRICDAVGIASADIRK